MLMSIKQFQLESGSTLFLVQLGKSKPTRFCDGSHVGTEYSPLKFICEKSEVVYFCGCKMYSKSSFFDGSHNKTI